MRFSGLSRADGTLVKTPTVPMAPISAEPWTGARLRDRAESMLAGSPLPLLFVGSHSPAYHFPDLPDPVSSFGPSGAGRVCLWPEFDWHYMFAAAVAAQDERISCVCVRPDERATEPVGWLMREDVLAVHCPSKMMQRLSGASCLEDPQAVLRFIDGLCPGAQRPWIVILAPAGIFGRAVLRHLRSRSPREKLVGLALGDVPPLFSRDRLGRMLSGGGARGKARWVKHGVARLWKGRSERELYSSLGFLWTCTQENAGHWGEFVSCPVGASSGGYRAEGWEPGDKAEARRGLGWDPAEQVVLSNCVIIPKKRLDDLIRAVRMVRDSRPVRLVLSGYGEGEERERLGRLAAGLGMGDRTLFTGYVPDEKLLQMYRASDVFVHLSAVEGGPASCMQALAVNLPVVMTPVGVVGKWIAETGMGRLFPVGDVEACARCIGEALAEKDPPVTAAAARAMWSWEAIGAKIAGGLLSSVLVEEKPTP
jgi:glycosyltransferase involved in cell wall biosynthesis